MRTPSEARHFLYPGQVFVTRDPITISTILGSCAAVCLWDRHKKAGGMNHYLLPEGLTKGRTGCATAMSPILNF